MNRRDFLHMMEGSVPVNRQMIGDVYELISLFPYFQSAHMLLLKGLQNSADVKFEKQLRDSSVHIADREVLYYFLKEKAPLKKPEAESLHADDKTDTTDLSRNEPQEYNNQQTVIESAKNSEDLISKIEEDESGKSGEKEDNGVINEFPGHSILIGSESDDEDPAGIILLSGDEGEEENERIFYMDPGITTAEPPELLELDTDEKEAAAMEDLPGHVQDEDRKLKSDKQLSQIELIDRFILDNPRIEPKREKTDAPQADISMSFGEGTGEFVTETLARIYISQGYYSRAIDIYEKLSLKFPEKSSYFASQIEMVKELIKK